MTIGVITWLAVSTGKVALALAPPQSVSVEARGSTITARLVVEVPRPLAALRVPLVPDGSQHAWVPWMKGARMRELGAGGARCDGRTKLPWPLKDLTWAVATAEESAAGGQQAFYRSSWTYIPGSGNLSDTRGSWTLTALGANRTRLELDALVDVGIPVPPGLERWAVRRGLPDLLDAWLVAAEAKP